jgi:hypothetical protein
MEGQTTHEFIADGELTRDGVSIPATVIGNYSEFEPDPVRCKVIPKTGHFSGFGGLFDDLRPIQFSGNLIDGSQIWIADFQIASTSYMTKSDTHLFEGIAKLFVHGRRGNLDEKFDDPEGDIFCSVVIPTTPIALLLADSASLSP